MNKLIELSRWREDRTPFDAIFSQFGLNEKNVIDLMRKELKINSLNFGENVFRKKN